MLTLAIILTSCIIKTPLTAVASLLDRIQADLGLSSSAAGLLNSLPLLAFAIVSLFISQLAQHCGAGRVCFAGMACSAIGILCCAALGKVFSLASNWTIPLAMLLAFAGLEILVGYMAGRPIVIPAARTPAEKL